MSHSLKDLATNMYVVFVNECLNEGYTDEYDAYHNENSWSENLKLAHKNYITFLHMFYHRRDGDKGFLGKYEK